MAPSARTKRAIDLLRQLMDTAIRELEAESDSGIPLSLDAQRVIRNAMARAFDAGLEHGKEVGRTESLPPEPEDG
jgi:hypothetical protein